MGQNLMDLPTHTNNQFFLRVFFLKIVHFRELFLAREHVSFTKEGVS